METGLSEEDMMLLGEIMSYRVRSLRMSDRYPAPEPAGI
jgi:hypothetical protein